MHSLFCRIEPLSNGPLLFGGTKMVKLAWIVSLWNWLRKLKPPSASIIEIVDGPRRLRIKSLNLIEEAPTIEKLMTHFSRSPETPRPSVVVGVLSIPPSKSLPIAEVSPTTESSHMVLRGKSKSEAAQNTLPRSNESPEV